MAQQYALLRLVEASPLSAPRAANEIAVSPAFLGQREQSGIENAHTDFTVYTGGELPWLVTVAFDFGNCVSVGQP